MKRTDRYLLGLFSVSWLISALFFLGMYLLIHFFSRMGGVSDSARAFEDAGMSPLMGFVRYYLVNIPFVLVEVLPFTVLMAGMWSLQHMARRNELVPLVTSGVSFRRLCLPVLVLGFAISLGFTVVKEEVLPGLARGRQRMERLVRGDEEFVLDKLVPIEDGRGHLFHIARYDVHRRIAWNVSVVRADDPGEWLLSARALQHRRMPDGTWGWRSVEGLAARGRLAVLESTDLTPRDIESESLSLLYLSAEELDRMVARNPDRLHLQVLRHANYAYPFSTLILLLMGLPLILRGHKSSPYVAAGLSLGLSIAYYSVQNVLQDMGARGEVVDPLLGAWLPPVLFGSLGVVMFETVPT